MVEDVFDASNRRMHSLVAAKVSFDYFDVTVEPTQVPTIPAREVVEHAYRIAALQEPSYEIRTDETPTPGHQRNAAHARILAAKPWTPIAGCCSGASVNGCRAERTYFEAMLVHRPRSCSFFHARPSGDKARRTR